MATTLWTTPPPSQPRKKLWQRANKWSREKSSLSQRAQGTHLISIECKYNSVGWTKRRHGGRLRDSRYDTLGFRWRQDGASSSPISPNDPGTSPFHIVYLSYYVIVITVSYVRFGDFSEYICVVDSNPFTLLHGDGQNQRTNHIDVLHFLFLLTWNTL